MVDSGYNTNANLRAITGMGAAIPTDAILDYWIELVDALIERYNASPDTGVAQIIEANRISLMYWNLKHDKGDTNEMNVVVAPLSLDEKEMLSTGNEDRTVWWE